MPIRGGEIPGEFRDAVFRRSLRRPGSERMHSRRGSKGAAVGESMRVPPRLPYRVWIRRRHRRRGRRCDIPGHDRPPQSVLPERAGESSDAAICGAVHEFSGKHSRSSRCNSASEAGVPVSGSLSIARSIASEIACISTEFTTDAEDISDPRLILQILLSRPDPGCDDFRAFSSVSAAAKARATRCVTGGNAAGGRRRRAWTKLRWPAGSAT